MSEKPRFQKSKSHNSSLLHTETSWYSIKCGWNEPEWSKLADEAIRKHCGEVTAESVRWRILGDPVRHWLETMPLDKHPYHIPNCIAGYSVCERIGGGSFSNVLKAVSTSANANGVRATVAIKVIDMRAANASKLSSDCVVSEIKILKQLKHKNIVHLYDFQWDRYNIYLIMEFCGGGDLSAFIKKYGPIPEAITRRFFRQLASAIQYMRAMDVAHMDLKPQNILLTNQHEPIIKISDFGLSQYLKKNEYASSFRGSPLYMAPEIFCRGPYDSRVDLWSCGIILYECLYGIPPFTADTYEKLVEQILSQHSINFPMNVRLSYDCLDLLRALLERNPQHRITFERFFSHPFVNITKSASSNELKRAEHYAQKSRQAESENNLVEAIKFLTDAIQIYISCLEMLEENEEKTKFRREIKAYLEHAEKLKGCLKPVVEAPSSCSVDATTEWKDRPQVHAAELVAHTARDLELQERWNEALSKYMLAIEGAIHVLRCEDRSTQRSVKLQRKVADWLSSAERIKQYMEVVNDEYGVSMSGDDEAEKQFRQLTADKHCTIM